MTAAVLFDLDGTLIDSNTAHAECWAQAFREHGHVVPVRAIRPLVGKGGDKLLRELAGLSDASKEGKAIAKRHTQLFLNEHLARCAAIEGGRALIHKLVAAHYALCAATSATEEEAAAIVKAAGVDDLLPCRTSSDDADESKPHPDIVTAGLQKVRADAAQSFLVGDTPYDVEAGLRAGVRVIGVRSGGWSTHELAGAVAVYDHVGHLARAFEDSPLNLR